MKKNRPFIKLLYMYEITFNRPFMKEHYMILFILFRFFNRHQIKEHQIIVHKIQSWSASAISITYHGCTDFKKCSNNYKMSITVILNYLKFYQYVYFIKKNHSK
jgi:hypothetical protein